MTDLPQIHDWFQALLTTGQWFFLWIIGFIALSVWGLAAYARASGDPDDTVYIGLGFLGGILLPPLTWIVLVGLGHFISFMIWLWFGGVGG